MVIFRIADNKIVEAWEVYDEAGMWRQLGVSPPTGMNPGGLEPPWAPCDRTRTRRRAHILSTGLTGSITVFEPFAAPLESGARHGIAPSAIPQARAAIAVASSRLEGHVDSTTMELERRLVRSSTCEVVGPDSAGNG